MNNVAETIPPLPIIIKPRFTTQLSKFLYFWLGFALMFLGGGALVSIFADFSELAGSERIIFILMPLLLLYLGFLGIRPFIWEFVWQYTFTDEIVQLQYSFKKQTYPVAAITDVEFKAGEWTHRHIDKSSYWLVLHVDDGTAVTIAPNGPGKSANRVQIEEKKLLLDLEQQLRHHYLPS